MNDLLVLLMVLPWFFCSANWQLVNCHSKYLIVDSTVAHGCVEQIQAFLLFRAQGNSLTCNILKPFETKRCQHLAVKFWQVSCDFPTKHFEKNMTPNARVYVYTAYFVSWNDHEHQPTHRTDPNHPMLGLKNVSAARIKCSEGSHSKSFKPLLQTSQGLMLRLFPNNKRCPEDRDSHGRFWSSLTSSWAYPDRPACLEDLRMRMGGFRPENPKDWK